MRKPLTTRKKSPILVERLHNRPKWSIRMPAVVWDVEQPEEASAKWRDAGPRVLDALAEWTGCDCAILRREAADAQNLVLEGYRFGESVADSEQLRIPRRK